MLSVYKSTQGNLTRSLLHTHHGFTQLTKRLFSHCAVIPQKQSDFQELKTGSFAQEAPVLRHPFSTDWFLQLILKTGLTKEVYSAVKPDLYEFGNRIQMQIQDLHVRCELEKPTLVQYDAYGHRIDELRTSQAWKDQKTISAEEGLIAIGYERAYSHYSRIYQAAKLYMYSPSSGLYGCPLAMTDGAARTIEVAGLPDYLRKAYNNLTSRDAERFWTSGQWMTEKGGGSDVANGTETLAYRQPDGSFSLHGYKWFSSATDADMSLTLARIANEDGSVIQGTKGLSMFYLETRNESGELNNIQIVKLKDKLGTRQLPTAELLLHGTKAFIVGEEGRGIATIADMLTVSRMYNCLFSSSIIRRMVSLCTDYSTKRIAFGKKICDHSLHMSVLASMEVEAMSSTLLTFELARLLGLIECGQATDADVLLIRLLTPISKLFTAKQAVSVLSEGLEAVGGLGYLEDSGLPSMYRDAQVLPIWEGTTNILSLDVLRAIQKTKGEAVTAFLATCHADLKGCPDTEPINTLNKCLHLLKNEVFKDSSAECLNELRARLLAFSLAHVYIGVLFARLLKQNPDVKPLQIALKRWCNRDLIPVLSQLQSQPDSRSAAEENWKLVMN